LNSHGGVEDKLAILVTGCRLVVSWKRWPFEPLGRTPVPTECLIACLEVPRGEAPNRCLMSLVIMQVIMLLHRYYGIVGCDTHTRLIEFRRTQLPELSPQGRRICSSEGGRHL
jgi:hypothetical protein